MVSPLLLLKFMYVTLYFFFVSHSTGNEFTLSQTPCTEALAPLISLAWMLLGTITVVLTIAVFSSSFCVILLLLRSVTPLQ